MQLVTDLTSYMSALFNMMNSRTADPASPPECRRINLFLKRKINKIEKKITNQAPLL